MGLVHLLQTVNRLATEVQLTIISTKVSVEAGLAAVRDYKANFREWGLVTAEFATLKSEMMKSTHSHSDVTIAM